MIGIHPLGSCRVCTLGSLPFASKFTHAFSCSHVAMHTCVRYPPLTIALACLHLALSAHHKELTPFPGILARPDGAARWHHWCSMLYGDEIHETVRGNHFHPALFIWFCLTACALVVAKEIRSAIVNHQTFSAASQPSEAKVLLCFIGFVILC